MERLPRESLQHLRPEVARKFLVAHRRDVPLEKFAKLVVVIVTHWRAPGVIPILARFLRSIRTARNTRIFTTEAEVPTASAMLSYGSSSTSASVAMRRYFAGSCRNAVRSACRSSL